MPEATNKKYETEDLSQRAILWSVATLGILLLATFLASAVMLRLWSRPATTTGAGGFSAALEPTQPAPEPRLQIAPAADLQKLRATEEAKLHRYEWIDRQAGIAAIPIERAMELVAKRGKDQSIGRPTKPAGRAR